MIFPKNSILRFVGMEKPETIKLILNLRCIKTIKILSSDLFYVNPF